MNSSSRIQNITDISDEILIEIILYLNVIERVPLANSCKRFHTLVFDDKKLLRDLDFSKERHFTRASDIRSYFNDEYRNKYILTVNLKNVGCMKPDVIFNYIGKAINLVDINIHGIKVRDRQVLEDLLIPLPHVKRLSIDWPMMGPLFDGDPYCKVLQERLGRLTYLSVRLDNMRYPKEFYRALQLCQELKELRMTVVSRNMDHQTILGLELKNLVIVTYYGPCIREVAEYFISTLSCPEEWTHFQLFNALTTIDGFYLERNMEVCKELSETKSIETLKYNYPKFASKLGGFVVPMRLLKEVMKINQENLPDTLCCFSPTNDQDKDRLLLPSVFHSSKLWSLKINEAKRLLKNPRYQISYLGICHNIKQECDAHLVALTFPSLNELLLSNITKSKQKSDSVSHDKRGEQPNLDSSFSKLVECTPHIRHLTVTGEESFSQLEDDETWDLAALHLIASWKSLTTLRLWSIPVNDGKFLIEIGKQCKHLENLQLYNLGPDYVNCYNDELVQMLSHCCNLRDFVLQQDDLDQQRNMARQPEAGNLCDFALLQESNFQWSQMFFFLANNPELREVYVSATCDINTYLYLEESIEPLLCRCPKLTSFICLINGNSHTEISKMTTTLRRLKSELNRPNFRFEVE